MRVVSFVMEGMGLPWTWLVVVGILLFCRVLTSVF